ncbi:Eco57I restriction-modification methylase domain-containing protein [Candidatus Poriferisodalis sp.]|uniref:Eco57I restriction-modification methylase domain-containing protein n=1 Tax=Candidatus Poriferisodalis sp. TaxID=3101277 RepID=UPI003B022D73
MSTALAADQRSELEQLIQDTRGWLEDDLSESLEGRFGIRRDGRIESTERLSLSNSDSLVRANLVDIVEYLRSEGAGRAESVSRLIREAAFTHINRMVAVRVAEAVGLLPETIAKGLASSGFRDFSELAPTVAVTEWGRFSEFVRLCADELATDVPALFDPRNPLIELMMSEAVLARVVEAFIDLDDIIWAAPDTLGWTYQYFNTGAERREMRESSAPQDSRELAVRNQFFTPSYVVDFLVHNGLGAYLASGLPGLVEDLPLLVDAPVDPAVIDLSAVNVLDPACGSGHFLLGAYDVLERAWQHVGVEPGAAAPEILASLWGIDIDPRATQIAQAAIMFRARRHCRDGSLPPANIICARSLPSGPAVEALIDALPAHVARVVRSIGTELSDAPVLGSLLRIEERLTQEVRDVFGAGVVEGTLSEVVVSGADDVEAAVLAALSEIAGSTTAGAAQRLFAAEASDAVKFVEAMARRYTAVLMNPPFGEPVPSTKDYLKSAYPWIPGKDYNLLAAFVGRGIELAEPGIGTCGAITSRAGLFLKTYEAWRNEVLLAHKLIATADLGYGVMDQALVEAAAYVLRNDRPGGRSTFIRLLKDADRPRAMQEEIDDVRRIGEGDRTFRIALDDLRGIPGSPVAYWMDESVRRLFRELPALEGSGAYARQGLATGDDFRFVRAFWEVDPERIGNSVSDTKRGHRWVPFAKGGEYSPFWADIHLVVDWLNDGEVIRGHDKSRAQNTQFYFRPGLTWPRRTNSGLGMRVLPSGTVFADKGSAVFAVDDLFSVLGWLRGRLAQAMIDAMVSAGEEVSSGGASRSYEVGLVQKLAWVHIPELNPVAARLASRRAWQDDSDETTRRFVRPKGFVTTDLSNHLEQLADGQELDELVIRHAGIDDGGRAYLDEEIGPFPLSYPETDSLDDRIADLYQRPIKEIIDELIQERGGSRAIANLTFVADRRLEVISHGLEVNPRTIVRVIKERGLTVPGESEDQAFRLVSYLVGLAFGRWDVRIGRDAGLATVASDLQSPPARYAPGTLLTPDGRAAASTLRDYPIEFPADGVLVDQPGHERDVTAAVEQAGVALSDSDEALDAALGALMRRPSLSVFLRNQFFRRHLNMYTMSRRKAPIYWQLQVPSKRWGLWLYAPKLCREMLFAVVHEADQRRRLADQQMRQLQREEAAGNSGRRASEIATDLALEHELAVELEAFLAAAERVANLGWQPNLDDGIVLNAAPLADLFPAWREAAMFRTKLRNGHHRWAAVAEYADQL